jgi:hypothetical protein
MLRVRPEDFRTSGDHAALMLLSALALVVTLACFSALPAPTFDHHGLLYLAATYFLFFVTLFLVNRIQAGQASMVSLVVVVLAGIWAISLLKYLIRQVAGLVELPDFDGWSSFVLAWLFFVWWLCVYFRSIRLVYRTGILRSSLLVVVYAVLYMAPASQLPSIGIWEKAGSAAPPDRFAGLNVESVYYNQWFQVDDATSHLADQRPGIVDLYFVGFAGWASQDVFYREISATRTLFDDRFDTKARSVVLVNNAKTVWDVPAANAHNLHQVLDDLAEIMDVDEDVLFLFLTSHGSPDGRLAVEFGPLQFNDLTPKRLKAMLDRSHIKNRVLVISACYSGGFIEALKDENTLVVTASRADRNSFGCSDEESWTYFGRAYFDEALRRDFSFTDAFDNARKVIAEREAAQSFTPSEPQIWVGDAIKPKLAALEARLRARYAAAAEKAAATGK